MKFDNYEQIVIESNSSDNVAEKIMSQYENFSILRLLPIFLRGIHLLNALMKFMTRG